MVKRMRKFSNWFSCESFLCQSHLYMSFTYSKSLFHQNNLSLGLYHPEKSFYLGLRKNCQRNLFKIELRILWSHFKPHKTFTKADLGLLQLHWKPLTIITKALHLGCCSSLGSTSDTYLWISLLWLATWMSILSVMTEFLIQPLPNQDKQP